MVVQQTKPVNNPALPFTLPDPPAPAVGFGDAAGPGPSAAKGTDSSVKLVPKPVEQPPAAAPESTLRINPVAQPPFNQVAQGPARPERTAIPLGAPTTATTAPITAPVPVGPGSVSASGNAQVESYDEETFACQVNETYQTISQKFYRTDKYARALFLFNRDHPLATDGAKVDPPILKQGQPVYIPPSSILEKYYGAAIAEPASSATNSVQLQQPTNGTPVSFGKPAIEKAVAAPERLYRVKNDGETLYQIAARTLTNADRWAEIYKLNPRFDPKFPIPSGTELRMPADAKISE
jgi:hypothetical protein